MRRFAILCLLCLPMLAADSYQTELEAWRTARVRSLRSDKGWLTVAGLFWLKPGVNHFGSAASNEIVLPAPAAPVAGDFEYRDGKVTAHVAGTTREIRHDSPDAVGLGPLTMLVIQRGEKVGIRLRDVNSQYRREFTGLHYFPVNEKLRVTAKWVAQKSQLPILNVLGQTEPMESPGYAEFTLDGKTLRLYPVLEEADAKELFYIFRDQTSAHETYGAGRFLYSAMPKDGTVVLDFNRAYNPPCAFTPYATCPLPPKENRLPVRIEAGELKYGDH